MTSHDDLRTEQHDRDVTSRQIASGEYGMDGDVMAECDRCHEPFDADPAWLERWNLGSLCDKCERIEAERPVRGRRIR